MPTITRILAILDPTAATQPALDKATRLARAARAELALFVCDPDPSRIQSLPLDAQHAARVAVLGARRKWLESLAGAIAATGVHVTCEVACHSPLHEGMLDRIVASGADLVVKDTHRHSWPRRALFTHTDWHLIRATAAPLLLVRPDPWAETPLVLAAIDPGHAADRTDELDRQLLAWAVALSRTLGGRAAALNVFLPPTLVASYAAAGAPGWVAPPISSDALVYEEESHRNRLLQLTSPAGLAAKDVHVPLGTPARLPDEAERLHADVVAMGAVSRGALKRMLIGSTAEDVLDRMPCDVLVVKPPDFTTAIPF